MLFLLHNINWWITMPHRGTETTNWKKNPCEAKIFCEKFFESACASNIWRYFLLVVIKYLHLLLRSFLYLNFMEHWLENIHFLNDTGDKMTRLLFEFIQRKTRRSSTQKSVSIYAKFIASSKFIKLSPFTNYSILIRLVKYNSNLVFLLLLLCYYNTNACVAYTSV